MTQPLFQRARTAGLTPRQAATLEFLYRHRNSVGIPQINGERERGWFRPADLGGEAGSNHSAWLRNLVSKGFADSRPYVGPKSTRESFARMYRISAAGMAAWERYAEHLAQVG